MDHLRLIRETIDWIELNIEEDLNIPKISEDFQISPWHFQRLFKSLVGSSLGDYIRGRKLTYASEQLLNSSANIMEIGMKVGFNSNEAFTRSFKSLFKKTPKQFRVEASEIQPFRKPQLKDDLLHFIRESIDTTPQIITRPAIKMIGYTTRIPSPFVNEANYCEMVSQSWFRLINQIESLGIQDIREYYGVSLSPSGDYTEDEIDFLSATPYREDLILDEDHITIELPQQQYAIFQSHQAIEQDVFNNIIDFIYGYWLGKSPYTRCPGHDLEIFEGIIDFHQPDFTTKYAIPIQ